MQLNLPLIYALSRRPTFRTAKAEPHRATLDRHGRELDAILRQTIETPSTRNFQLLRHAVFEMHEQLLTVNFVEETLIDERRKTA